MAFSQSVVFLFFTVGAFVAALEAAGN